MKYLVGLFALIVFGAATALSAISAVVSFQQGEYLSLLIGAGIAITGLGLILAAVIPLTGRVQLRFKYGADGAIFYPDRVVNLLVSIAVVSFFIALSVYLVSAPFDRVATPLLSADRGYYTWISAAALVMLLPAMKQIVTRGGKNYLRLAPNGIELGSSFSTTRAGWDDLVEISDRPAKGPQPLNTGTTFLTVVPGRTKILPSDWYTPRGQALRQLIQFYWQHPECRDELVDGRAVERLNRYQDESVK